jgi:hypothetical protein
MTILQRLRGNLRYAMGLRGYLRDVMLPDQAQRLIEQQMAQREESFLMLLKRGIYERPDSPYRRLLLHCGFGFDHVVRLVEELGLEAALARLYDAGVYVTQEEFKSFRPIIRPGLEVRCRASDFDNPLLTVHYTSQTSGSRGVGTTVLVELDRLLPEAAYLACLFAGMGLKGRPIAFWKPLPPNSSGLNTAFRYMKVGRTPVRWFSQSGFTWTAEGVRSALFLGYTLLVSYLIRRPMPRPRYLPREKVVEIARWLATVGTSSAAVFDVSPSGAIRIAIAAKQHGLDISGTLFRVGGEPFTEAMARELADAGTSAITRYGMAEVGNIALGCPFPAAIDDLHVLTDKLAVLQRDKPIGASGEAVPALVYTTLHLSSPKLMLNTESGDYGTLTTRDCDCALGKLGFTTHLTGLRSYDKLTSEGVTFMGSELYRLVEETLPARFGGSATDYQLVEEQMNALPSVSVVVAPGVGPIDESALVEVILEALRSYPSGGPSMTEQWRQGETLRVVRREPYVTGDRKILPLHLLRDHQHDRPA